jgi:hypothetical protein
MKAPDNVSTIPTRQIDTSRLALIHSCSKAIHLFSRNRTRFFAALTDQATKVRRYDKLLQK